MFGLWRKNDGFKWVQYVPTQILARRQARKDRVKQVATDAKDAARQAAKKSVAGIEHGVAQAGSAAAAGAVQAGQGLERGARKLSLFAGAGVQKSALALGSAGRALGHAGGVRMVTALGAAVLLAAGIRIALYGFDRAGRITVACGVAALALAALPALWRSVSPGIARLALQALKTRRVTGTASVGTASVGTANAGAASAGSGLSGAQAGTLAVTAALGIAALSGIGWSARWVYSAVMSGGAPVTGTARVLGSQVVKVGEHEFRLAGIAAPDGEQSCGEGNRRWRCGEEARRALSKATAGKTLVCHPRGEDDDGRRVAQCLDGKTDIAEALVRGGYVWADRDDSAGYRALEEVPRTAKTGIWKTTSVPPWIFRERLWADAQRNAPDSCPIKGESSGGDKTYHMPWGPGYQRVRIAKSDLARGSKLWFCTEREARDAGYKPAGERR
jgi:endonuclease YncB( thermonuclease family)